MTTDRDTRIILPGLAAVFLILAVLFLFDLWGRPVPIAPVPPVDPEFIKTATVRESASFLFRTDGDTSGLDCYACHEKGKTPEIHLDEKGAVILDEKHNDLVMSHGRDPRNNLCFNCHDSTDLTRLRLRDGSTLKITESSQLCAGCHGPTHRDWEAGIHGRSNGHWDRSKGEVERHDCTACHDPHNPAFAPLSPAPGPHPLHPVHAPHHPQEPAKKTD